MMLTVDNYYDWYLKGKSLPEIMREIEKLRKTMASLKSKMESPKYNKENSCWPNEKMQICATRAYLNRAKEAYVEDGGVYEPTKAEKKKRSVISSVSKEKLRLSPVIQRRSRIWLSGWRSS